MKLKAHLNFIGDRKTETISVNKPGYPYEILEIEVDNYDKIWEYLNILSEHQNTLLIKKWREKYNVNSQELNGLNEFLRDNYLVYDKVDFEENSSTRVLNFINNFVNSNNRYDTLKKIKNDDKYIVIVGLGTVGTSLLNYFIQFEIKNFILIDSDIIENKNIKHQKFYKKNDIKKSKVAIIKKYLDNLDENYHIHVIDKNLTDINQLKKLQTEQKISVSDIFCCFDDKNPRILREIYKFTVENQSNAFISGYNKSSSKVFKLTNNFLKYVENNLNSYPDFITENSGIGILGDISAQLLIRLWLQEVISELNFSLDTIEYDFINLESNDINKNFIDDYQKNEFMTTNKNIKQYIVEPKIHRLYSQYLKDGQQKSIYEIQYLNEIHHLNIDLDEEIIEQKYLEKLENTFVDIEDKKLNLIELTNMIANRENLKKAVLQEYFDTLSTFECDIRQALKWKKEKMGDLYKEIYDKNKLYKPILKKLNKAFVDIMFPDNIEIDFLDYNKMKINKLKLNLSEQMRFISGIDTIFPEYNIGEYIKYLKNHNFLNVSKFNLNSFQHFDERYKCFNIFVQYSSDIKGIMTLAHEINHAYFLSYIQSVDIIKNISEDVKEIFACIGEFLLQFYLLESNDSQIKKEIFFYLYERIGISLSLDFYEENLFNIDSKNLNWKNIIQARKKTLLDLNRKIKNDDLSDFNIVLNTNLLFEEKTPFLYPKAYILAFKLVSMFTKDPSIFFKFVNYLSNPIEKITVNNLLKHLNISLSKKSFDEITSEFISYLNFLMNQEENENIV